MIMIADSKLPIVREENESKIEVNQNSTDESVWQDTDDDTEIPSATEFRKTKPPPRSTVSALKMRHVDWKERHGENRAFLRRWSFLDARWSIVVCRLIVIEAFLNKHRSPPQISISRTFDHWSEEGGEGGRAPVCCPADTESEKRHKSNDVVPPNVRQACVYDTLTSDVSFFLPSMNFDKCCSMFP